MTNEKIGAAAPASSMSMMRRIGRYSLFFATAGFACPNVFSENLVAVKYDAENKIKPVTP